MKIKSFILICLIGIFAGCQNATPLPTLTITDGEEFTLTVGQSATTSAGDLTIRFIGVGGDQRCPRDLECAISGPVSLSLSVQQANGESAELNLQTFTGNDGRAPEMSFEGIEDRVTVGNFLIQVKGVLPYPVKSFNEIKDAKYQVTLWVKEK